MVHIDCFETNLKKYIRYFHDLKIYVSMSTYACICIHMRPFQWSLKIGPALHMSPVPASFVAWGHARAWFNSQKTTTAQMIAQDIQYVMKDINPPNAPQIHPIENYWSIGMQKVYIKTIGMQKIMINSLKESNYVEREWTLLSTRTCFVTSRRKCPVRSKTASKVWYNYFLLT